MDRFHPNDRMGSWRDYTFNAGPLQNQKLRDITDQQLQYAIRSNQGYIRLYSDPDAVVATGRLAGERVGDLRPQVVDRRLRMAQEALKFCEREREYRQTGIDPQQGALAAQAGREFGAEALKLSEELHQLAERAKELGRRWQDLFIHQGEE